MSLISDWKNWCRTCGKNNLLNFNGCYSKWDSLDEDSLAIMRKLILTDSEMNENGNICIDCHTILKEIVTFSKRCRKIADMYAEINLDYESIGDCDLSAVRSRYDLKEDDDDDEVLSVKNPFEDEDNLFNPNELVKIEIKSEDIQENVEPEYIFTNSIFPIENDSDTRDILRTDKKEKTKLNSSSTRNRKRNKYNKKMFRNPENVLSDTILYDLPTDCNTKINKTNGLSSPRPAKIVKKTKIKKSINCPICNLSFNDQIKCELHMNTANHSIDAYPFNCSKCPKRFTTEVGLTIHDRVHSTGLKILPKDKDAFVCDQCGKRCSSNANLGEHLSTHSDDYPYQCTKCPKKFKHIYNLRRHEITHSNIICICDICNIRLITKTGIRRHMVVHSEQKKYKCNYCGNEYKRSKTLKTHLILHTGQRPYKCPFCDKTFVNGSNCRSHKKKAHPIELAAMEAAGEVHITSLPKLRELQPK